MGRSNKNNSAQRPNAPDFQILQQQQPAHNPYYPDPSAALLSSPPPPYSELTVPLTTASSHYPSAVPMSPINTSNNIQYPRIDDRNQGHVPIVIQSTTTYDRRAERYNRKIRSFNNQTMMIALLVALTSAWAFSLYESRPCVYDFTVHKPDKDISISIRNVRDFHYNVTYLSCFVFILCLAKAVTGYNSKSYSCYLLLMALVSFVATCSTGYLAYLALYSPCAIKLDELGSQISKTIFGKFSDKLPGPEQGFFGERNVIALASEDKNGALIFVLDAMNCFFYFSVFLTSIILC